MKCLILYFETLPQCFIFAKCTHKGIFLWMICWEHRHDYTWKVVELQSTTIKLSVLLQCVAISKNQTYFLVTAAHRADRLLHAKQDMPTQVICLQCVVFNNAPDEIQAPPLDWNNSHPIAHCVPPPGILSRKGGNRITTWSQRATGLAYWLDHRN